MWRARRSCEAWDDAAEWADDKWERAAGRADARARRLRPSAGRSRRRDRARRQHARAGDPLPVRAAARRAAAPRDHGRRIPHTAAPARPPGGGWAACASRRSSRCRPRRWPSDWRRRSTAAPRRCCAPRCCSRTRTSCRRSANCCRVVSARGRRTAGRRLSSSERAAVPAVAGRRSRTAFVVGGGYKYCQLGEGNCFLRVPPGTRTPAADRDRLVQRVLAARRARADAAFGVRRGGRPLGRRHLRSDQPLSRRARVRILRRAAARSRRCCAPSASTRSVCWRTRSMPWTSTRR